LSPFVEGEAGAEVEGEAEQFHVEILTLAL
jgi:hypothetical protein